MFEKFKKFFNNDEEDKAVIEAPKEAPPTKEEGQSMEFIPMPASYVPDFNAEYFVLKSLIHKNDVPHLCRFSLIQANLIIKQVEFTLDDYVEEGEDVLTEFIQDCELLAVDDLRFFWNDWKSRSK